MANFVRSSGELHDAQDIQDIHSPSLELVDLYGMKEKACGQLYCPLRRYVD